MAGVLAGREAALGRHAMAKSALAFGGAGMTADDAVGALRMECPCLFQPLRVWLNQEEKSWHPAELWHPFCSLSLSLSLDSALIDPAFALQIADGQYAGEFDGRDLVAMQASFNGITAKGGGGGAPLGSVIIWTEAENPEDMENWHDCDGGDITGSQLCTERHICTAPNFQGLFLRGYGSQTYSQENGTVFGVTATDYGSGGLGEVQGDSSRRFYGTLYHVAGPHTPAGVTGPNDDIFEKQISSSQAGSNTGCYFTHIYLKSERILPTSNEIRPVNMAVRYLIRINE